MNASFFSQLLHKDGRSNFQTLEQIQNSYAIIWLYDQFVPVRSSDINYSFTFGAQSNKRLIAAVAQSPQNTDFIFSVPELFSSFCEVL